MSTTKCIVPGCSESARRDSQYCEGHRLPPPARRNAKALRELDAFHRRMSDLFERDEYGVSADVPAPAGGTGQGDE
jgi:hypothetical protein